MKNVTLTLATFFAVTFSLNAQAWHNASGFTEGAKIALHRVWGESMGYATKEETAAAAELIYKNGTYVNKRVANSGVSVNGTIKKLPAGTYSVTYLGSTDATLLGGLDGHTAKLYLKADCGNLDWVFVEPTPEPAKPVIYREKVTVYDTIYQPLVVKPMTVRLQLCTASYIHGCHQQTFFHGVKEVIVETLPYEGEYVDGKKFVTEIPKFIPSCEGIKITDYFWMTAN